MNESSPNGLALKISFLLAVLTTVFFAFITCQLPIEIHIWTSVGVFVFIFLISFLLLHFSLKRFILERINLVYRSIGNSRTETKEENIIDMQKDVFSAVKQEVEVWAKSQRDQIKLLKTQEVYRKEYIGNLAHELKTPVFSIQGYLYTLLEGGLEDQNINRTYLERAAKVVDRMIDLIEDLDDINKLESGRMQLKLKKFDIVDLAKEVLKSVEIEASEMKMELRFDKSYEKPLYVEADKARINQVLINLITNAIKYGRNGGYIELRFNSMGENILIEVVDDGIGIAEKHLSRLFERFYRIEESRARDRGGSGLGLSIVKHILDAHEQTINVKSTIGIGSTFSFTLRAI